MKIRLLTVTTILTVCLSLTASLAFGGNKKIMTTRAAKVMAERAIVEAIYGLKIRATEKVENMIAAGFSGKTESKTTARIKGITIEEVIYDPEKDIARATAMISLKSLENIDGEVMQLNNKIFRRVAFATSTPSQAGPIKALRAAELDAYKQMAKRLVGFTLESQTTVENYMLTSDLVKTKVLATLYLSEVSDYGWDEEGDAYVKMTLDMQAAADILGEGFVDGAESIEVEGQGSQEDDYSVAVAQIKPTVAQ